MMQWNTLLKSLGFTDSEARIYLLAIELGPSSVQDIAKKAKVSRVTTYAAIESLASHGLMSSFAKGKKTLYTAESPDRLVSFVHTRVKHMENTLREMEGAIHELKLTQHGDKPVVKLFEGKEGLRAIHEDILKTKPHELLELNNIDAMLAIHAAEEFRPFQAELVKRKFTSEIIALYSKPIVRQPHTKIHHLSEKDFSFFGDIIVYGNKVALTTFKGSHISVMIESEALAQTMRVLFQLASKGAKNHSK